MATKKRAPLRVEADPRPKREVPKPKPPEPKVSVFVASRLTPAQHQALAKCTRLRFVSEADACCDADKRHAQVWVAAKGRAIRPRPPGQRVLRLAPDDDPVAKVLG